MPTSLPSAAYAGAPEMRQGRCGDRPANGTPVDLSIYFAASGEMRAHAMRMRRTRGFLACATHLAVASWPGGAAAQFASRCRQRSGVRQRPARPEGQAPFCRLD